VGLLRGGELASRDRRAPRIGRGGFAALGARVALARRGRMLTAVAVVASCGALVLLVLDLASLVVALRDDPGSVGKRYQLTAALPPSDVPAVRAIPGVADAAPRYVAQGADSFALGETVELVAFGGDHTRFEDPPLASGRRLRGPREAEVGTGLAQALGLRVGGELAVQLAAGAERRFRVVGTVRALDHDGRVAYVRAGPLVRALPGLRPQIAVRLRAGASRAGVAARLEALGATPVTVGGATTSNSGFLGTLATLLRVVAALDALVCLYALVRTLGLTAAERRRTLAVLRAAGAPATTVGLVLAGAATAITVPSTLLGLALERGVLAPAVTRLASTYADLPAGGAPSRAVAVAVVLVLLGLAAAAVVARRVLAEPPVAGLGEEW
jgi:hypothetical protein